MAKGKLTVEKDDYAPEKRTPGLEPGSLLYEGDESLAPVKIHVFDYDAEFLEERELHDADDCIEFVEKTTVTWIDVDGVHDVDLVEKFGRIHKIHPLTLEDVVHTRQRPKLEEFPDYGYIVFPMLHYDHEACGLEAEQVSLILGPNFVISFQEAREGDVFEPIRARLRENRGRIRRSGADYLAYALVDLIVDYYMEVLYGLNEHIERLEDAVVENPEPEQLHQINTLRNHVRFLRRSVWPLRDVITRLERTEMAFVSSQTSVYFRDVADHALHAMEMIDSSREMLNSMVELYQSTVSFKMNEVMKVLTIIATFFLPLSFIAGLYGMNFNPQVSPWNMPELGWAFGYLFALGIMGAVALGMFVYFRRKKWM